MYADKPLLHQRQKDWVPGGLRTVALDVTGACNMTCDHCYAVTFRKAGEIELSVLKKALDEFYDLGVFHYVLQGGEAIVDPARLEYILRNCHPDEAYINVVSNGWAMTGEKIRWLKELKVDKIAFSLDSGIEAEHDENRLPGSFQRTLKAIDMVLEEGLLTSISTVVTHQSLYSDSFQRVLDIARDKRIRLDVQIAEPVGKWDGRKDCLITPEDNRYIKHLQQTEGLLPHGQTLISRDIFCGDQDHCPAGREFVGLTNNGDLLPCNFLQFTLGNVRNRSIREMRADLMQSPWFDGNQPICICGEDERFIDEFITPYVDAPKPLDAYSVFCLKRASEMPQD